MAFPFPHEQKCPCMPLKLHLFPNSQGCSILVGQVAIVGLKAYTSGFILGADTVRSRNEANGLRFTFAHHVCHVQVNALIINIAVKCDRI